MENEIPFNDKEITSFVEMLNSELPDIRDNRGKRHSLTSIIVGVVLATLVGRQKLSEIHRFISNRFAWLSSACTNKPFFEKYHTIFMEYFLNFNSAPQKNHQFLRIA